MEYMLLIYENEASRAQATEAQIKEGFAAYEKYTSELSGAGVMRGGNGLQPTAAATTVRVRDGKSDTADGPFAETGEQFSGYYVIECADLDTALKWAAKCPGAHHGSVEVRPVMAM